jgi:ribosomal protein S27AE
VFAPLAQIPRFLAIDISERTNEQAFQKGKQKMARHKSTCPRCGGFLETLKSYAHCSSCLYFEDYWSDSESDFHRAMKAAKDVTPFEETANEDEEAHEDKECA